MRLQAMCQDLIVTGPKGSLRLGDFVIPHNEKQCSYSITQVSAICTGGETVCVRWYLSAIPALVEKQMRV